MQLLWGPLGFSSGLWSGPWELPFPRILKVRMWDPWLWNGYQFDHKQCSGNLSRSIECDFGLRGLRRLHNLQLARYPNIWKPRSQLVRFWACLEPDLYLSFGPEHDRIQHQRYLLMWPMGGHFWRIPEMDLPMHAEKLLDFGSNRGPPLEMGPARFWVYVRKHLWGSAR